jgi:hypothetical protein
MTRLKQAVNIRQYAAIVKFRYLGTRDLDSLPAAQARPNRPQICHTVLADSYLAA